MDEADFNAKLDALAESYLDWCSGASTRSLLLSYLKMLANESAQVTLDYAISNYRSKKDAEHT